MLSLYKLTGTDGQAGRRAQVSIGLHAHPKYYFCTEKANNVLYCEKLGYYFMFGKFKYVLFSSNIPYTIWSEVVCGTPDISLVLSTPHKKEKEKKTPFIFRFS